MKIRRIVRSVLLAMVILPPHPAIASGPFIYDTQFFDERNREDLLAGHLTDRFRGLTPAPLIAYLHLTGQMTPEHALLFRIEREDLEARRRADNSWRHYRDFGELVESEGFPRPDYYNYYRSKAVTRTEFKDGVPMVTKYYIDNCQPDAFRVARDTLQDRRSRYGSGSPELRRWIKAQLKVFEHCGNERFDPPGEAEPDWGSLEKYDRQYQLAASYFYDGQYLEAARRFMEIGAVSESPWSGLSRYLVGRSLMREATVDEENRENYLRLALRVYRRLAQDPTFFGANAWILTRIRYVEALLDPAGTLNGLETKLVRTPELASIEDLRDYVYLYSSHGWKRDRTGADADWLILASRLGGSAEIIARWRKEKSLEWLYLALIAAGPATGEETLREVLEAAAHIGMETPGYYVMLEHRIRLLALLGETQAALSLADRTNWIKPHPSAGRVNRVRLRAANVSPNWEDYFRLASMRPLDLPWSDAYVRSLSSLRFNHVTRETRLFPKATTDLLNNYFTPRMMLAVTGYGGLGDYQRGRVAIAGWTKAVLLDDLHAARDLSRQVKRYVPRLKKPFESFETGEDPHFEAAVIVLDNPAFSPYMWAGAGRVQVRKNPVRPAPDYIALPWNRYNWWCPRSYFYSGGQDVIPSGPRFDLYEETQREGNLSMEKAFEVTVAEFFGPFVLNYARSHLDDPRLPRTLHRLVFANRYSCMASPAKIAEEAHSFLHKHFANSEWAAKTRYSWE